MSDNFAAGTLSGANNCQADGFNEAVCIHTDKIYDQCRDKDCTSYKI